MLLVLLYLLVVRLPEFSTYGVVGEGKVVEPTELDRPAELRELRPGGVGINGALGADTNELPVDNCGLVRGIFDPRIIGPEWVSVGEETYGELL